MDLAQELFSSPVGCVFSVAKDAGQFLSDAREHDLVLTSAAEDDNTNDRRILLGFGDQASERSVLRVHQQGNNVSIDGLDVENDATIVGAAQVGAPLSSFPPSVVGALNVHGDRVLLQGGGSDAEYVAFSDSVTGRAALRCVSSTDPADTSNTAEFGCTSARGAFLRYNGADRVNVDKRGRLGIGTAAPRARLHVSGGNARVEGRTASSNAFVDGRGYDLGTDVPTLHVVGTRGARELKPIAAFESAPSRAQDPFGQEHIVMTVNGANEGRVGVRTRDPQHTLDVRGDIFTAGQYLMSSDARLKTDMQAISGSLDRVRRITGYTFKKTRSLGDADHEGRPQQQEAGFVAQQVREVLPEAVPLPLTRESGGNDDALLGVSYSAVSAVILEALKELDAKVTRLERDFAKK